MESQIRKVYPPCPSLVMIRHYYNHSFPRLPKGQCAEQRSSEGYLLAREQLGLSKTAEPLADVLVVEDAPAGIRAGKAAGCDVLALLTTHSREVVEAAGADFVVEDLESVEWLGKDEDGVLLLINPTPLPTASVGINLINEAVPN